MTLEKPIAETSGFAEDFVEICRFLQQWHKEEKLLLESDPNEPPETNWHMMARALFFLGAGGLVILLQSWTGFVKDYATLGFYIVLVALCGGFFTVLILHAQGIFEGRFWRSLYRSITKPSNFPFAPLVYRAERDAAALPSLARFSDDVLKAVSDRLSSSEARFREGLSLLGGNSSLAALAALVGGAWGAWKSFRGEPTSISMITLAVAVGVVWASAYAFNLRFSLFELTRCRDLIALELARRKSVVKEQSGSRAQADR